MPNIGEVETALKQRSIIFGSITIAFWLSLTGWFVAYPLPLETLLAEPMFRVAAATIALGIVSGVLLVTHPLFGRVFALLVCTFTIAYRLWWFLFPYSDFGKKIYTVFLLLRERPVYVIHVEIIAWMFLVATVVFLLRKPTA